MSYLQESIPKAKAESAPWKSLYCCREFKMTLTVLNPHRNRHRQGAEGVFEEPSHLPDFSAGILRFLEG